MKQLIDFIPLILFFIFYKMSPQSIEIMNYAIPLGGIYSATLALVISTVLISLIEFMIYKKISKAQFITLIAVLLFGGLTLGFKNDLFIKWKAPVINWVFGIAILCSAFIGKKTLIERMMGHVITMPPYIWKNLNLSWAIFFILLGTANLYVAFNFETIWVDFKIFGSLGLTLLFTMLQIILLRKHIKPIQSTHP